MHQVGHLPIAASVESTDCQLFSPSWCRTPSEVYGQLLDHFKSLVSYCLPAPSLRRELAYPFSEVKVLVSCSCLHIFHCVFMNLHHLNTSSNVHYIWPLSVRALFNRVRSIKSLSFYMTSFSASLTNFTALLPQSSGSSCSVSRLTLAPPPL